MAPPPDAGHRGGCHHTAMSGPLPLVLVVPAMLAVAGAISPANGQAPGVPIERSAPLNRDAAVMENLARLRDSGRGMDTAAVKAGLAQPTPAPVTLPPCRTTPLRPAEVWKSAQQSRLWIGWHYLCHKCDHWHANLAGGYPLTSDGVVATCHHVADPGPDIREGRLVAVDADGQAWPVTAVLAANRDMDACLLRVEGLKSPALPLNDQIQPGDPAYLLSSPLGVSGYFSSGMVNRFFWSPKLPSTGAAPEDPAFLRINVSTDWAPGSSGSPVLDACGNAICHVATISHLGEGKSAAGKDVAHLTLHEGIPARSLITLARHCSEEAARPADAAPRATFAALREAISSQDFTRATTLADALEPECTDDSARRQLLAARFLVAAGTRNEPAAGDLATRLAESAGAGDATTLNEAAWKLVTAFAAPQPATLTAADRAASRSVELHQRRDPASLDTLARIRFLQSQKDEAIRLQEEAVALAEGDLKSQLEKTLASYRAGTLPDVSEG